MIDCDKLLQRLKNTSGRGDDKWYRRAYSVFHGRALITQGMANTLLVNYSLEPGWYKWVGYHIDAMARESESNSQKPPFVRNLEQKVQWLETRLAALESRLTSVTPSLESMAKASGEGLTCTRSSEGLTDSATRI